MSNVDVIVVGDQQVSDLMSVVGGDWTLQPAARSVEGMWAGLNDGSLSPGSSVLVFSPNVPDQGDLVTALATMAPHALVLLVLPDLSQQASWVDAVNAAGIEQGHASAPIFCVTSASDVREVVSAQRPGVVSFAETAPVVETPAPVVEAPAPVVEVPAPVVETVAAPVAPPVAPVTVAPPVAPPVAPVTVAPPVAAPMAAPVAPPVAPPVGPVTPVAAPTPVAPPAAPVAPPVAPTPVAAPQPVPAANPVSPSLPPVGSIHGSNTPADNYVAPDSSTTLTFFSSKGGSGKSTTAMMVATTIAHASAAAGKPLKVVLVDMDTRDGQVASLVGAYAPTALNIRVAEDWNEETVLKNLIHAEKLGIDCLLAPIRPRTADDVGPDFYRHVIRVLQHTHDVVIMDCSVNYLDPLISTVCLPEAKAVLFVTTMATTAVQGMARALREITEPVESGGMGIPRSKIGIVVNQSAADIGLDKEQVTQAALSVPIVGAIPMSSTDVLKATNRNKMHFLIKHPNLGPAYLRLARVCLPTAELADINGTPVPPGNVAAAAAVPQQMAATPPATAQGEYAPPEAPTPEAVPEQVNGKPKRTLLGRKKG